MLSGLHTRISHQQGGFQFFVKGVVNLGAREHTGNVFASFLETRFQFVQPRLALNHWRFFGGFE
jgi:hypothetical protein